MKFTIKIHDEQIQKKLISLERKKGEYISSLIKKDMQIEEIVKRLTELEKEVKGEK